MNDLDLDPRLVERVRHTLRAVAEATPMDEDAGPSLQAPAPAPRRSLLRPLLAAAASVAVVMGLAVVMTRSGRTVHVGTPADTPAGDGLPAGFDPATAVPVFSAEGDPAGVAGAYLRARFPDYPMPGVTVTPGERSADRADMAWSTAGDADGPIAHGVVMLRKAGDRWAVIAATTAGVDLSGVSYDGKRVRGAVRSTNQNSLFADVLTVGGQPVRHAPHPNGQEGQYRFGTAAGPSTGALDIDVPVRATPSVLRVQLVGGTMLSISEVRLDPPPLAPHHDMAECVKANSFDGTEPTADVVWQSCAAALQGTVFGSGAAGGHQWELVTAAEAGGQWVTLRSRDMAGMFHTSEDTRQDPGVTVLFKQLGPCCTVGEDTLVVGVFGPEVHALRVAPKTGPAFEAETVADPVTGVRYAVVAVPRSAVVNGPATTGVRLADGSWHDTHMPLELSVTGG
ncbi:MAG: hypothetical protein QOI20_2410 [Acidimicrobiaceae bacterium]|nr:hypothetical protein [Acidimicrobiaceae bacterium]